MDRDEQQLDRQLGLYGVRRALVASRPWLEHHPEWRLCNDLLLAGIQIYNAFTRYRNHGRGGDQGHVLRPEGLDAGVREDAGRRGLDGRDERARRVYQPIGRQAQANSEQENANNNNSDSRDTLNNNREVQNVNNIEGNANNNNAIPDGSNS